MIDKYIILNRKPKMIINLFFINIFLLTGFVIWGINTFTYTNYFLFHSQFLSQNSYYFLEVLVPVKEVKQIMNQNTLWINETNYSYRFLKKDDKVVYQDGGNYINVYLEIFDIDNEYLIDGYHLEVKFCLRSDKIINLLKNKEEY